MRRRAYGGNVSPTITQVNPATRQPPATIPTPPVTPQGVSFGGRMGPTAPVARGAVGTPTPLGGGGGMKDQTDARIVEALISYLRRKVL